MPARPRDLSASQLLFLIWRRRFQFIAVILLGVLIGGGVSLLLPKKYESRASFIGVGGRSLVLPAGPGALGALAGQLGIGSFGGTDAASLSPFFYADLVTADTILRQLARVRVPVSGDTNAAAYPLLGLLAVRGRSHADSIYRAVRRLHRMIVVDLDARTGVIEVTFTAPSPYLAAAAADSLLTLVNGFLGRDVRTRAGAQRRFLQDRVADAERQLGLAQDRLRAFLESNRDYRNSPALQFREAELQRDLDLKRDLYLSVARSLEEARINEVRDTPLLSVIDRPSVPPRPSSPKPLVNAVLLGLFMPVLWLAFVLLRQRAPQPEETARDRP
jgi:uncharacterized protein involved in exopolysaccharide biosynthesis